MAARIQVLGSKAGCFNADSSDAESAASRPEKSAVNMTLIHAHDEGTPKSVGVYRVYSYSSSF